MWGDATLASGTAQLQSRARLALCTVPGAMSMTYMNQAAFFKEVKDIMSGVVLVLTSAIICKQSSEFHLQFEENGG